MSSSADCTDNGVVTQDDNTFDDENDSLDAGFSTDHDQNHKEGGRGRMLFFGQMVMEIATNAVPHIFAG